ncbi:polymorphic toxin type 37 domain-containing protein, partial [Solilutibacter pythonis]|uniref:polymorphic toxin type 37 domain-containing protein n=1 Tax=Solilutibacter pythonis TaxID=2483112 RepID=UPI001B87B474
NTYAYVGGNPVMGVDPLGLQAMAPVAGWIGTDTAIPDPSDAAWPKWVIYGALLGGAWALDHWVFSEQQDGDGGAQAPGMPTADDGYECPKKWDGKKVKSPNGRGYGWPDKNGNVWVPTGPGSGAHGGPHWGVQRPGGGYINVYPGGRTRGGR